MMKMMNLRMRFLPTVGDAPLLEPPHVSYSNATVISKQVTVSIFRLSEWMAVSGATYLTAWSQATADNRPFMPTASPVRVTSPTYSRERTNLTRSD